MHTPLSRHQREDMCVTGHITIICNLCIIIVNNILTSQLYDKESATRAKAQLPKQRARNAHDLSEQTTPICEV